MTAKRVGPYVVMVDHHGQNRAMFLAAEVDALGDEGRDGTEVTLRSGVSFDVRAPYQDVFDAVSAGVAVGFKVTFGKPFKQAI
jgi:hypothetical protein